MEVNSIHLRESQVRNMKRWKDLWEGNWGKDSVKMIYKILWIVSAIQRKRVWGTVKCGATGGCHKRNYFCSWMFNKDVLWFIKMQVKCWGRFFRKKQKAEIRFMTWMSTDHQHWVHWHLKSPTDRNRCTSLCVGVWRKENAGVCVCWHVRKPLYVMTFLWNRMVRIWLKHKDS